jgi:hypothetical protein
MEGARMKKKVILCLKGILLYTTGIVAMLFISGIDSIYDNGYFEIAVLIVAGLIYACYKTISNEELDALCFTKLLKIDKEEEGEEW